MSQILDKSKLISFLNRFLNQIGQESGDHLLFLCPFHIAFRNIERRKFGISLNPNCFGFYNCFACNESGKGFKSLLRKLKASKNDYKELHSIVGDKFILYDNDSKDDNEIPDLKLPKDFLPLYIPNTRSPIYKNALYYLKKRNVTRDDILRYNIGYCENGIYRNRIIIPSYDKNGDINFFSARDFLNISKWKYLLPPWSKNIIGNELFVNWEYDNGITLVEGSFDGLSIRNNTIPLFGKSMSLKLKYAIMENNVKRVNICLDNDAELNSLDLCEYILKITNGQTKVFFVRLPNKDPNEIGFEKMIEFINNAEEVDLSYIFYKKMRGL